MRMELTAVYLPVDEGYVAWMEEFPGAVTQGRTLAEAREMLVDAIQLLIETAVNRPPRPREGRMSSASRS